ncbi:hypothetical protein [Brachybacterium hainanense]
MPAAPAVSAARRALAAAMSRGRTERGARSVRRALEQPGSQASPDRIARILAHARAHVPFYRALAGTPFAQLPVVSKAMILEDLPTFLAEGARPGRLASRMSSGTSGVIFTSYFDARRIAHHRAELVGAYRFLGADPFGSFLHCRDWFEVTRTQRRSAALRGQFLYAAEEDERTVLEVASWLSRRRGSVVIGLCSYLEILLRRFEDLDVRIEPGAVGVVLGTGEPMTAELRARTRRQLGVPLSMRYSNTENGLLGFTRPGESVYSLNTHAFHVEILRDGSDAAAAPGEVGRIVVTDLENRALPFLRYDTGDMGRFALDASGTVLPGTLAELSGRTRDFPLAGTPSAPRRVTHIVVLNAVEHIPGIRQFQLRQHDLGRFTWVVNAVPDPAIDAGLRAVLDAEIGDIVSCEVVYTDGPLRTGTGKRQTFVSEIPDPEALLRAARAA